MFGLGREAIDRVAWTVVERGAGIGGGAATAVAGESRFTAHREAKMKAQMSEADACSGNLREERLKRPGSTYASGPVQDREGVAIGQTGMGPEHTRVGDGLWTSQGGFGDVAQVPAGGSTTAVSHW